MCYANIYSIIRLVNYALTGLFRERLGGHVASGGCPAMAIISTYTLLLFSGAAAAPENDLAKKMMHHLVKNFNKNMLPRVHARTREGMMKVRRQRTAHSAPTKKEWVGGRAGLRQGPSSLNPAGVNGLIPAKK